MIVRKNDDDRSAIWLAAFTCLPDTMREFYEQPEPTTKRERERERERERGFGFVESDEIIKSERLSSNRKILTRKYTMINLH